MNNLLLATLVISGAVELVVGLLALLDPTGFAQRWLGVAAPGDPIRILILALALAGLGLAALHILAIRWVRDQKPEGVTLSIAMGGGIALFGIFMFGAAQWGRLHVAHSAYLLTIDGLRGVLLAAASVLARNAPQTVKQLRLPSQREAARMRPRRESEPLRSSRGRLDHDRRRGRRRERREASGGGSRRDRPQASAAMPVRDDRQRERPFPAGGQETRGPRIPPGSVPESKDLGVVVTGRPPQGVAPDRIRTVGPEPGSEESTRIARPPAIQRGRPDGGISQAARPERAGEPREPQPRERERGEGGEERRRRRRRRRSSSRPVEERGSAPAESAAIHREESEDFEKTPSVHIERRPLERPAPIETDAPAAGIHEAPEFHDEPIDRISAFGGDRSSEEEPAAARSDFGRTTRPFTQHRKGRQVKPREQKIHRSLGGEAARADDGGPDVVTTPRRIAVEGQIGMADGIGPIDLDEPEDHERT